MPNRLLMYFCVAAIVAGCQSPPRSSLPDAPGAATQPLSRPQASSPIVAPEKAAPHDLSREGDLKQLLRQAERQLNSETAAATLALLSDVDVSRLSEPTIAQLQTLRARAHADMGSFIDAYRALSYTQITTLEHWSLLEKICTALSLQQCRGDSLIAMHSLALPVPSDEILHTLLQAKRAPDHDAVQLANGEATPIPRPDSRAHRGWHALVNVLTTTGSRARTHRAWQNWQAQWQDHAAAIDPPTLIAQLADPTTASIALMLPLSGQLGNVGRAVRDGFIAAYLAESDPTKTAGTLELHIFDSAEHSALELIRLTRNARANILVGPLLKANVDAFSAFAAASETPTLLLNYLPAGESLPGTASNLLQLGTAIEDEATTLATLMRTNQHERVMVVHNDSTWANKALQAFRQEWPHPIFATRFSDLKQLTRAVGNVMDVSASTTRKERVAALLGEPVEFLPRARQDLDAVLALTTGFEAAALIPALQFHFADHLPVYATSQSLRDSTSPEGFSVAELPLLTQPNRVERDMISAFNLSNSGLVDLYALGVSAFQMATWTPALSTPSNWREHFTLRSSVGQLQLHSSGRISRNLAIKTVARSRSGQRSGAAEFE